MQMALALSLAELACPQRYLAARLACCCAEQRHAACPGRSGCPVPARRWRSPGFSAAAAHSPAPVNMRDSAMHVFVIASPACDLIAGQRECINESMPGWGAMA